MPSTPPRRILEVTYDDAARSYLRSLPPEHFMEATAQATQREITVASFALVRATWALFQYFSELLVQYRIGRPPRLRQVVPDNMVVLHPEPIDATTNYAIELQPARPTLVLEYVSKSSKRKDYEDSFRKYERELKVPYYLTFYPDEQELTLFHLRRSRYRALPPGENGRHAIPELEMELALLGGWVRYWFRGELLPLPAELHHRVELLSQELDRERQRADKAERKADDAQRQVQVERAARLRAEQELAQLRAQLGLPPAGN